MDPRKGNSLKWTLPSSEAAREAMTICKTFFLSTLGFGERSDSAVLGAVKTGAITPVRDQRGRTMPNSKADEEKITEHIMKYKPVKHHYRYEHVPNRLYLPTDITVQKMYADYTEAAGRGEVRPCSRERYRQSVRRLNIGNTQLSAEECSKCSLHIQYVAEAHGQLVTEPDRHETDCPQCDVHKEHLQAAKESRESYRKDADRHWQDG